MKATKKFMALIIFAVFAVFACVAVSVSLSATTSASAETAEEVTVVSCSLDEGEEAATTATLLTGETGGEDETGSEETSEVDATSAKAIAAAIAIGLAALGGAIAMGLAIAKAMDGISRQPEAAGNIRSTMMLGLVFVETVVIYALIVSILLVFVL